jgi:hypothetical protein
MRMDVESVETSLAKLQAIDVANIFKQYQYSSLREVSEKLTLLYKYECNTYGSQYREEVLLTEFRRFKRRLMNVVYYEAVEANKFALAAEDFIRPARER